MNKVLAEYISICSQFRKDGLSKPERKQRHAMLSEWAKNIHAAEIPGLAELYEFRDCYGELCYNNYFIKSIIIPVVAADFENNGIDGIKFCSVVSVVTIDYITMPIVRYPFFVTLLVISTNPYSWLIKFLMWNLKTLMC